MKKDSIVELDYQKANLKSIQKNIEKMPDNAVVPDGTALGGIIPGKELTPEQKEKLAKENLASTQEAERLAAEARERDIQQGKGEPVVNTIAESLKEKLENKEFQTTPAPDITPPADEISPMD